MSTPTSSTSARNEVRPVVPRLIELPYAGWPGAVWAARIAKQVFEEKKA